MWHDFRKGIFKKEGFYVLKNRDGKEESCYAYKPEKHHPGLYSFFIIYENTRKDTGGCDFGIYKWPNSYSCINPPVQWRRMTKKEEREFRTKLYQFDRKRDK